jgi:hypothetical protein
VTGSQLHFRLNLVDAAPVRASRITRIAFDDFLHSSGATAKALSDAALNNLLGSFDQLAIEAVVDQVTAAIGPVSLKVQIAHSGDGVHWIPKRVIPEVSVPSTLSLTGPTYMDIGYDDGTTPTLGLVRLELELAAAAGPIGAHVRIHVTANDFQERDFTAALHEADRSYPYQLYDICYPAGSRIASWRIKELVGYWLYRNELQVDLLGTVAIVPARQMVCFNAVGDYILVVDGKVVWSSRAYWNAVQLPTTKAPPKYPNDPQGGWTLEGAGDMTHGAAWKKLSGLFSGQGTGHDGHGA